MKSVTKTNLQNLLLRQKLQSKKVILSLKMILRYPFLNTKEQGSKSSLETCMAFETHRKFSFTPNQTKICNFFTNPIYLFVKLSDFSALSIALMKRLTYQVSEYWYMGSMFAKSVMQKNKMAEWIEMGL